MHKYRLGTFLEKVILDQNFRKMLDFAKNLNFFEKRAGQPEGLEHHGLEAPSQRIFLRKSRFSARSRFEEARKMENEQRNETRTL